MRPLSSWLAEYDESHRNPTNERLHWVCVPLIALAVMGLLASIPLPGGSPLLNLASIGVLATLAYYAALSVRLAAGMLLAFAALGLLL